MKQEQDSDPHYVYEERMTAFLKAIKNYQKSNLQKINTRYDNEERQQIGKIKNDSSRKNEEDFKKLQDGVKVAQKIFKSRKLNECRMRQMKVRFDMIEKIKEQAKKNLLKQVQNATTYKAFLKQLITQGLIKLLEENIQIRCLKVEEKIIEEVIRECQQEFNQICEVQTKLHINKNNYLTSQDIGGVVLTSFKGKIVCDNTLRARLSYCMQLLLPQIRSLLFKESDNWLASRNLAKKKSQQGPKKLNQAQSGKQSSN